jgi:patatin-related protein
MDAAPALTPERELRLAVVMYGGVSLAVYMNGAAQELLNLVKATAPDPGDPTHAWLPDERLAGTSAAIYRELARLAPSRDAAPGAALDSAIRQRFVVDILSGTSAGGINAIFLAKALASGREIDGLARLWEAEADLGKLINDRESLADLPRLARSGQPKSLLNSQRMYVRLLQALESMDPALGDGLPLVDEVDLFVTATDLEGLPVRLQLAGGEVAEERRYRKVFHLSYNRRRHDFRREDNPFLAFVARCTSSFPVAFEPMQLEQMHAGDAGRARSRAEDGVIPARWHRHFEEYERAIPPESSVTSRPFADGGYLDNKPFSYAIDAIASRQGGSPGVVERKLVYIEPDPEQLAPPAWEARGADAPNVLDNSLEALRIRSYETIREDLLRLRDRNRVVDKTRSVVAGIDADFQALAGTPGNPLAALADIIAQREQFGERALDQVVAVFGAAYGGYHRLKVGEVTDDVAQVVAARVGVAPASDEFRALRLLVRAWRNARYSPNPRNPLSAPGADASEFRFLEAFDLSYRIRRLSFVIEQLGKMRVLSPAEVADRLGRYPAICGGETARSIAAEHPPALAVELDRLRADLSNALADLRAGRDALLAAEHQGTDDAPGTREAHLGAVVMRIMAEPTERRRRARADAAVQGQTDTDRALSEMLDAVRARVAVMRDASRERSETLLVTDSRPRLEQPVLRTPADVAQFIGRHYYTWFELYDSMVFPIVYGTEVGEEVAPVEPVRISPLSGRAGGGDAPSAGPLTPSGVAVGHFGAFLHRQWRARDILIGRMNAAEKLIRTVVAGTVHDAPEIVDPLVRRAHQVILEEEYRREGSTIKRELDGVGNLTSPDARLAHVTRTGLTPATLAPADIVDWIARSAKVLGRVLQGATDVPVVHKLSTAVLYAGHVLTGVVEVVVPRRWWGNVARLWVPRVLLFALALLVLGPLFGKEEVSSLGWTVLLLLGGFLGLTVALRLWIERQWSTTVRVVTALAAFTALVLLAIGVLYAPQAFRDLLARVNDLLGRGLRDGP